MKLHTLSLALCALLASACADDLQEDIAPDAGNVVPGAADAGDEPTQATNITHTDNGDGTRTTVVDATDYETKIYLDLGTGEEKTPNSPEDSMGWDLSFQRFAISMNGGVSGSGDVEAKLVEEGFDGISIAPVGGYETDQADGPDENEDADLFFDRAGTVWYDYDPATHVLTPRDVTYVVRSVEGDFYKIKIESYYSDAGTAGHMRFTWGPLAPATVALISIDASASDSFVYLNLETGSVTTPANPEQSMDWDLAVRRTGFRTNSGTSGPGTGGAIEMVGQNVDAVVSAPAKGYQLDALLPIPGPPGSGEESRNPALDGWYDYNPTTHEVSPRATTYVVRHADGDFSKVQIQNYSSGMYQVAWAYAGDATSDF